MGKGRSRRRKQRKRRSKQDVICLPPPQQPPLSANAGSSEVGPVAALSAETDVLVKESGDLEDQSAAQPLPLNRQARRRARRERAKARKRRGKLVLAETATERLPSSDDYLITKEQLTEAQTRTGQPAKNNHQKDDADLFDEGVAAAVESLSARPAPRGQDAKANPEIDEAGSKVALHPVAMIRDVIRQSSKSRALADPNERILAKLRRWASSLWASRRNNTPAKSDGQPNMEQLLVIRSELAIIQKRLDKMIGSSGN